MRKRCFSLETSLQKWFWGFQAYISRKLFELRQHLQTPCRDKGLAAVQIIFQKFAVAHSLHFYNPSWSVPSWHCLQDTKPADSNVCSVEACELWTHFCWCICGFGSKKTSDLCIFLYQSCNLWIFQVGGLMGDPISLKLSWSVSHRHTILQRPGKIMEHIWECHSHQLSSLCHAFVSQIIGIAAYPSPQRCLTMINHH